MARSNRTVPLVLLVAAAGIAWAGESPYETAARAARERMAESARVYTNEDLGQVVANVAPAEPGAVPAVTAAPTPAGAAESSDPLAWLAERRTQATESERKLTAARVELEAARRRVSELESQIRALRNPLLPRPELSEPDRAARDKDADAPTRLARLEQELTAARERLAAVEAKLALPTVVP